MKFALAPLALALVLATAALAQEDTATATATEETSVAPPEETSSSVESSSSASATSAPAAEETGVCELLPGYEQGDPQVPNYGCPYTSTSTPPYDSSSLQSYLIGAYRPGKEGEHIEDVASQLAQSVTRLYPTITVDFDAIQSQYAEGISASIEADDYPDPAPDSALSAHGNKVLGAAGLVAAVVAGGAFLL